MWIHEYNLNNGTQLVFKGSAIKETRKDDTYEIFILTSGETYRISHTAITYIREYSEGVKYDEEIVKRYGK
jgi:hypothetical protein